MKWILATLLLISATALGQIGRGDDSTKYIRYQNQYGQRMPRSWWDSVAHMPYGDTAIFPKPIRPGAIMMHTDKSFYKWNGGGWDVLGGGAPSGSAGGDLTGTYPNPTIASNAVTNPKFRQSAGLSVVGTAGSSTANVADITASVANTYLRNSGSTLLWDSVDYAHLKNKPDLQNPGVYFGPAQSFDPTFVVFASAIIYPYNSWTYNDPIDWRILDHASGHNSSFIDSAGYNTGNGRLKAFWPTVKNVLNATITPDESFSSRCISVGPTVAFDNFEAPLYTLGTLGIRLTGAGTSTWTKNSASYASLFDVDTYNTGNGQTRFDVPYTNGSFNFDPDAISINYVGTNGYTIKRTYSGLGAYSVSFILQDAFGNPVTSAPTSSDEILISNSGQVARVVSAYLFNASNQWIASNFNFWVFGAFECWLVAAPTSTTSTLIRWQTNYPSATNYKIYRSTTKYGTRTLIHTGTDGSYTDTGLSSATLYYYHLVAVIGGVDTYITYFTTNTK